LFVPSAPYAVVRPAPAERSGREHRKSRADEPREWPLVGLAGCAAIVPQLLERAPHGGLLETEADERAEGLGVKIRHPGLDEGRAIATPICMREAQTSSA
jgi:hypothetical protein